MVFTNHATQHGGRAPPHVLFAFETWGSFSNLPVRSARDEIASRGYGFLVDQMNLASVPDLCQHRRRQRPVQQARTGDGQAVENPMPPMPLSSPVLLSTIMDALPPGT